MSKDSQDDRICPRATTNSLLRAYTTQPGLDGTMKRSRKHGILTEARIARPPRAPSIGCALLIAKPGTSTGSRSSGGTWLWCRIRP